MEYQRNATGDYEVKLGGVWKNVGELESFEAASLIQELIVREETRQEEAGFWVGVMHSVVVAISKGAGR